ncbi:MAG: Na+/H+ antiporter NhaA [Actinomycetota bacterium]|nr:Na+/H+ antiporter NhaA [Actinomycetota bacterium]
MPRIGARSSAELARYLRTETVGGALLLVAAAAALVWVNSPVGHSYEAVRDFHLGPSALHLSLTVGTWAQDGLLAVFFFIAGIEVKREMVVGELSDRKSATLPVVAALGGVLTPALVALALGWGTPGIDKAWAVPVATDIAFALGVLALTGSRLPASARVFLLSLAVVDDLVAIVIIAVLFTDGLALGWVAVAVACLALYAFAQYRRITWTVLYVPLALLTWFAVHQTGIHATFAGVALGLLTRVRRTDDDTARGEKEPPASRLEHRLQPFSAGLCVPLFALFAAGVPLSGAVLARLPHDRIAVAIFAGLILGKAVGIFGTAWLAITLGLADRPRYLGNRDMLALSVLGGIGFTVSLLVAELGLGAEAENAKAAVLIASALASVLGAVLLVRRGKAFDARRAAYRERRKRDFYEVFDPDDSSPADTSGA